MKGMCKFVLLAAALLPGAALADEVTCESIDNRQNECDLDTRGDVRLVRQLSKSPCREGDTWGVSRHSVWVRGGCRGVFASSGGRVGDDRGDYRDDHGRGDDRGRDWERGDGRDRGRDDDRGRGRDDDRGRDWERGDDRGRGRDDHAAAPALVPDDDADYKSTGGKPPQSAVFGCLRGRQGRVIATNPLQTGWWEIILRLDDGRYACNVDNNGNVGEFRRLR